MSDQSQGAGQIPAGWYEQPAGGGSLRWWDGRMWTDHRTPVPADRSQVPPPPEGVLPPRPPTPPPSADPVAARAALVTHLEAESTKFASWAGFFIFLTLLGSLGIGWVASQESVCDFGFAGSISCDTETDAAQFAIVAVSTFVASLLFVLPLRGIASLLRGTAAVLKTVEPGAPDGDSDAADP